MNELMIVIEGGQWIYYSTVCKDAKSAMREAETSLSATGFNVDNVRIKKAVLRDAGQNEIDSIEIGGAGNE